jgi:hypothetical protein
MTPEHAPEALANGSQSVREEPAQLNAAELERLSIDPRYL